MNKRKKIIITVMLAAALFVVGVLIGGSLIKRIQNKGSCTDSLKNVNYKDLAEKIISLNSANLNLEVSAEKLESINEKTARYLTCQLTNDLSQEDYNGLRDLIGRLNITDQNRVNSLEQLEENYIKFQEREELKESPLYFFATSRGSELCPIGKENPEKVELAQSVLSQKIISGDTFNEISSQIDSYCQLFGSYLNDQELLEQDIYEFTSWPTDQLELEALYFWKLAWAINFGNQQKVNQFCGNLPIVSAQDRCLTLSSRIEATQSSINSCPDTELLESELKDFVCLVF